MSMFGVPMAVSIFFVAIAFAAPASSDVDVAGPKFFVCPEALHFGKRRTDDDSTVRVAAIVPTNGTVCFHASVLDNANWLSVTVRKNESAVAVAAVTGAESLTKVCTGVGHGISRPGAAAVLDVKVNPKHPDLRSHLRAAWNASGVRNGAKVSATVVAQAVHTSDKPLDVYLNITVRRLTYQPRWYLPHKLKCTNWYLHCAA